jgi:hypothetical protein
MGTLCQCKLYGDRMLIQKNIYGISLITMNGMRAGVHSTLGSSPGNLVFNRDIFLNTPLIADWQAITQKREHLIHENRIQENQKRRWYNYLPEQRVLKKHWKPHKLDARTSGPYRVLQTQVNGTVTIELRLGVSERLNIWRVNRTKNEC